MELHVGADGVRVRDHGEGVLEADLPYVFDRFFRGTNSRGRQGSGLGLAIVRQVTEQHGGAARPPTPPTAGPCSRWRCPPSPRTSPTRRRDPEVGAKPRSTGAPSPVS